MNNDMITVFTPTYNRAYIITNLYEALRRQSRKNFEWLIIDDGSTDGTEKLIKSISENSNGFPIRYYYKENGGQHRALNMAIEKAEGFLLFIADSDDIVTDNAIEIIFDWCETVKKGEKIAGVSGPRQNMHGNIIGDIPTFPERYIDASEFERAKYHLRGDKVEAFYVDILRQYYPIESFDGERSAEKAILWQRLAIAGYKVRWFKDIIYCSEYLEDGMSAKKLQTWLNNFEGYTVYMRQYYAGEKGYSTKLKRLCTYLIVAEQKGLKGQEIRSRIGVAFITYITAKSIVEIIHKRVEKKHFWWMLGLENGDSYNTVKVKNR